jgi:diguanylate cyclase (GGDEF)-like protein
MFNLRNRSRIEAFSWVFAFLTIVCLAVTLNAHEALDAFFRSHEEYQLDEVSTAFAVAGALGLAYSVLRLKDLSAEANRRRIAEQQADIAALHDCLTGLPNRRMLDAEGVRFERYKGKRSKHAAFCIDLDGLKKVNDELGQSSGDAVLKEVARRLSQLQYDDAVFHVGGDRFVVVASASSFSTPQGYAQRIVKVICQPITIDAASVEVAVSLGFATFPSDAENFQGLVRSAECAMYFAKKVGPNVVKAFTPSMDRMMRERAQMLADLKLAIRDNTIVPHYQPLVDLKTRQVIGYEALARWEIQPGQFVSPCEFIPLAEETGLISELTNSLFSQACRDAVMWPEHIVLAFNISASQLVDRLLGLKLLQILDKTGLPGHRVELEVTESAIIQDAESASFVIGGLVQSGIKIAIDDFGTGYSSLSQLSGYQFHKLKIDRSFIASFEQCEKQDKIVKAIIALGASLGMKITAEGIEHESQFQKLAALGCDVGQGYLLGKPEAAGTLPFCNLPSLGNHREHVSSGGHAA